MEINESILSQPFDSGWFMQFINQVLEQAKQKKESNPNFTNKMALQLLTSSFPHERKEKEDKKHPPLS